MKFFAKIVNAWNPLAFFEKQCIMGVCEKNVSWVFDRIQNSPICRIKKKKEVTSQKDLQL